MAAWGLQTNSGREKIGGDTSPREASYTDYDAGNFQKFSSLRKDASGAEQRPFAASFETKVHAPALGNRAQTAKYHNKNLSILRHTAQAQTANARSHLFRNSRLACQKNSDDRVKTDLAQRESIEAAAKDVADQLQ